MREGPAKGGLRGMLRGDAKRERHARGVRGSAPRAHQLEYSLSGAVRRRSCGGAAAGQRRGMADERWPSPLVVWSLGSSAVAAVAMACAGAHVRRTSSTRCAFSRHFCVRLCARGPRLRTWHVYTVLCSSIRRYTIQYADWCSFTPGAGAGAVGTSLGRARARPSDAGFRRYQLELRIRIRAHYTTFKDQARSPLSPCRRETPCTSR